MDHCGRGGVGQSSCRRSPQPRRSRSCAVSRGTLHRRVPQRLLQATETLARQFEYLSGPPAGASNRKLSWSAAFKPFRAMCSDTGSGVRAGRAPSAASSIFIGKGTVSGRSLTLPGISKSAAHRRFREVAAQLPAVQDLREHRKDLFADIELTMENLRPLVHDDEVRPRKGDVDRFLRAINLQMRVVGLFDPPPPNAAQRESANRHTGTRAPTVRSPTTVTPGQTGRALWWMVVEHPAGTKDQVVLGGIRERDGGLRRTIQSQA